MPAEIRNSLLQLVKAYPRLAFIGGTGPEGRGLAMRMAGLGFHVIIGSRSAERANEVAGELSKLVPEAEVTGLSNLDASKSAQVAFLTIPYAGVKDTVAPLAEALANKIVITAIAPLEFQDGHLLPARLEGESAASEVQTLLLGSRVVSAFQSIDAYHLQRPNDPLETDVIVCSDDKEARHTVMELAGALPGVRPLSGGRLEHSAFVEQCTGLLITLNRIYKAHSGIRLTGID